MTYTEQTGEAAKCGAWFKAIANGNHYAEGWLWAFWNFSQLFDDLVDGDRPVTQAQAARALADWWAACSLNPWFIANAGQLWMPVTQAIERWQTADEWIKGRPGRMPVRAEEARVLRHGDLEVCLAVAFITGGWEHALRCRELRTWDEDGDRVESVPTNVKG